MTDISRPWKRRRDLFFIVLLALLLRLWAAWQLPVDADEPVYLQAAYDYAQFIRAGEAASIINYSQNFEHPPLVKLLYGAVTAALGERPPLERVFVLSSGRHGR